MRKHLFRGKRLSGGEWVQGGIAPAYHSAGDPMAPEEMDGYAILADGRAYAVEQDSIGEWTGLRDREGLDLFEDDLALAQGPKKDEKMLGRIRFGMHAPTMQMKSLSMGFWIEWAHPSQEFLRKDLGYWREKIARLGPWFDHTEEWDRACENAGAAKRMEEYL